MKKHAVITGANRGIGLALTNEFLNAGFRVTAACRNPDGARDLWEVESHHHEDLKLLTLDVADPKSRHEFAKTLGSEPVDVLINNAGIYPENAPFSELSPESLRKGFEVNTLGPIFVTQALLPQLQKSKHPVVAFVSSKMGSITDNTSGGSYGYRMSKTALNMFLKSFALDHPDMISITLHPGWVQTDMGGKNAPTDTITSAKGLCGVVLKATKKESGKFFDFQGKELPW